MLTNLTKSKPDLKEGNSPLRSDMPRGFTPGIVCNQSHQNKVNKHYNPAGEKTDINIQQGGR